MLTIVVVAGPLLGIQLLAPDIRHLPGAFTAVALALTPVCLIAAFLLYLRWRLVGPDHLGLATVCLALFGAHGFTMAGLWLTHERRPALSVWEMVLNLVIALTLTVIAWKGERLLAVVDPLTLGISAGLCVSVLDVVVMRVMPPLGSSGTFWALTHAVVLGLGAMVAAALVVRDRFERSMTIRLAGAITLLAVPRLAMTSAPGSAVVSALSLTCGIIGAVVLSDTAIALLGRAVHEKMRDLVRLKQRLGTLDAERRAEEERLHEIRSTIAAIASASRLIRCGSELAPARRARLEEMLEVESRRLVRLVHDQPIEATHHHVDLDSVIRPLVTAQEVQGRTVRWAPTGDLVDGDPDRLGEAINILLDNAAKHAGTEAEVRVRHESGRLRIEVEDDGPGVAHHLRDQVFSRGVKSQSSRGQGLGLHLAQKLVRETGSTLRLGESEAGARFVIEMPHPHPVGPGGPVGPVGPVGGES